MDAILNVGLNGEHRDITPEDVLSALRELTIEPAAYRFTLGKTNEPTLIVHALDINEMQVYDISESLGQDCIAVYDLHECSGKLIGPKADQWGSFNADYFSVL